MTKTADPSRLIILSILWIASKSGKSFAKVGIEGMINLLWRGILLNSGPDPHEKL
jgi:hypothetical protein